LDDGNMSATDIDAIIHSGYKLNIRAILTGYWSLAKSEQYHRAVTVWLGVFCAGFCLMPAEWEQRWLFYIGIPLALPAVVDVVRRAVGGPLFWTLTAFLAYSGASALWSGNWLTVGDEMRRAFWIEYFLLICCWIGSGGMPWLHRVLQAMLVFVALVALVSVVDFLLHTHDSLRFGGFGRHAKSTWTAMIGGALALIGLAAALSRGRSPSLLALACQAPISALIIATGSRGALPAYFIALLLSAFLVLQRSGRRQAGLVLGAAVACLAIAGTAVAALGPGWLQAQIGRGDSERLVLWSENLQRVAQRPWFGHGATALDKVLMQNGEFGTHAHNLFLSQAYYGGLVGLALWIGVFALALRVGLRVLRARGELLPLIPIVFLLMIGTVDIGSVVVDVQPEWLYVWVVLGIALAYDTDLRRTARTSR
jgi:O-antigen ligase